MQTDSPRGHPTGGHGVRGIQPGLRMNQPPPEIDPAGAASSHFSPNESFIKNKHCSGRVPLISSPG